MSATKDDDSRLSALPAGWRWVRLKFLARVQTGMAKGKDMQGVKTVEVPYLRVANVQDGYLDLNEVATMPVPVTDLDRYRLQPGDVLMNEGGDFDKLGRGHVWHGQIDPCIHQNHVFAVRPHGVSSDWLNAYTGSAPAQFFFMGQSKQSTNLASISSSNLMELRVPVPPEQELRRRLVFVERETARIGTLIEKKTRFIELLREKRQALITKAVTQGLNQSAPMKHSGLDWLGRVPSHWAIKPFKYCVRYQEGPGIMAADFHDEGVPLLRISCVQGRVVSLEGCNFLAPAKVDLQWDHFRLSIGDLLISGSASMGVVSEVGDDAEGAIAYTGLIRLRGVVGQMQKDYLRWLVVSDGFLAQIDLMKAGSTIQHFGPTHLDQMFVCCPPIEEQHAVAQLLDDQTTRIDLLAAATNRSIDLLGERRAALITAAITGQIDVREAA